MLIDSVTWDLLQPWFCVCRTSQCQRQLPRTPHLRLVVNCSVVTYIQNLLPLQRQQINYGKQTSPLFLPLHKISSSLIILCWNVQFSETDLYTAHLSFIKYYLVNFSLGWQQDFQPFLKCPKPAFNIFHSMFMLSHILKIDKYKIKILLYWKPVKEP